MVVGRAALTWQQLEVGGGWGGGPQLSSGPALGPSAPHPPPALSRRRSFVRHHLGPLIRGSGISLIRRSEISLTRRSGIPLLEIRDIPLSPVDEGALLTRDTSVIVS